MLYPDLNEKYYVDGEQNIKKMMEDSYTQALTINQSYWTQADMDTRFKAGDQDLWDTVYASPQQSRRRSFDFNRMRTVINMITGHQRKTRKSMVTVPVESSDQYTSDQISKALFWATKKDNMLETISEAFEGACTCGMNLLSVWMDYRHDSVNGDLCVDNVSYSGYLLDPYRRKVNMSDCNYAWRRMWKAPKQLKTMFKGREKDIDMIRPRGNVDGKFNYMIENYSQGVNNLIALDEYWYLDTRKATIVEDVQTGDSVEYFGEKDILNEFVAQDRNRVVKTIEIPTVKLVYCVDGQVFYHGVNPNGHEFHPIDRYPLVPVYAYHEPDLADYSKRIQGVCRGLRDAQYLYNRRKVIELDIYESQVNSGWIYEDDALNDPNDVYMTGQGKGISVKAGRIDSVRRIECPRIDPTMLQLSQSLGDEIMKISGVNEELLGMADDDKAGILSMLRQGAGLTTLQKLFDQLDYSQKMLGEICVEMIQANFRPAKIQRITNQEASPQFHQKAFQRFDVEIEEGLNTTTQKQMQFAQMLELFDRKVPIAPEDLLDSAPIQNKSEIVENMKRREEAAAKQQEQQMAMQMKVLEAQVHDINSRALANQGLGVERISRVEENRSLATQREAEAVENISQARLNKVKSIKELDEMDLNQLQKLIEIVNSISLGDEEQEVQSVDDSKDSVSSIESGFEMLQKMAS